MATGLGRLRLPPAQFWAMTLPEFTAALHGLDGRTPPAPLARRDLDDLRARFPDTPIESDHD